MMDEHETGNPPARGRLLQPAEPLWRLAPTKSQDGGGMADFMMLIPGLADRSLAERDFVADAVLAVCASFGEQVTFADINYRINVLWVSIEPEPGLAGRVACAIRQRVPDALLVGGQLGATAAMTARPRRGWRLWGRLRRLSRRVVLLIESHDRPVR
jgi:hypothetical protein